MHDITRATDPCFRKKIYSTLGRMAYRARLGEAVQGETADLSGSRGSGAGEKQSWG